MQQKRLRSQFVNGQAQKAGDENVNTRNKPGTAIIATTFLMACSAQLYA